MLLDSGHEVTFLQGEELEQQQKDFKGSKIDMVRLEPDRWLYLHFFTRFANKIYNFQWRRSDVVVMTYPKCGTTWMQEIIWTMRNNANFDHPSALEHLLDRVPFIESDMFFLQSETETSAQRKLLPSLQRLCPDADPNDGFSLQLSVATPDPRTIKTHLAFSLFHSSLLDSAKVVYVARNPKDVLLSFFHHSRLFHAKAFIGTLEEFLKYFINGNLVYGAYDKHVKEAWERRAHPNLHFVFYEDMQVDLMKELHRLNDFLGTHLTEEQLKKVADHTSFDNMKASDEGMKFLYEQEVLEKDGGFFRKGKSGDWKKSLPVHLRAEMDSWINKQFNFGITFK